MNIIKYYRKRTQMKQTVLGNKRASSFYHNKFCSDFDPNYIIPYDSANLVP